MTENKIYEVWEQWPNTLIACFWSLVDADTFVKANGQRLALPIITSITLSDLLKHRRNNGVAR